MRRIRLCRRRRRRVSLGAFAERLEIKPVQYGTWQAVLKLDDKSMIIIPVLLISASGAEIMMQHSKHT